MELYDPIVPSTSQEIYDLIKSKNGSSLGDVVIEQLGPVGDVVEKWELKDCQITNVDFGRLDWNAGNQVCKIILQIHYTNAILHF